MLWLPGNPVPSSTEYTLAQAIAQRGALSQ
jgi:hypothetical protein